ncbi:MAP kinase-interacting serine/threonine-protein kinase 2 [Notothenia coriiceps]|uniref:MAP kinase-interacting serine/threonine-protein kinase 2 n=1 Tax=Notothenia coriiceps TaxID=8208 RepID=A0A6I9PXX2_9TELE|nr:PREDICTED: MAP kinase-interacting serine/threonine-protein kinase 1 [Notothenia coriiceps]
MLTSAVRRFDRRDSAGLDTEGRLFQTNSVFVMCSQLADMVRHSMMKELQTFQHSLQGNSLAVGQVGQSCEAAQGNGVVSEQRQPLSQGPAEIEKSQPVNIPDAAKRKKKKRTRATDSSTGTFDDLYKLTDEVLGRGAFAKVQGCISLQNGHEFAVKVSENILFVTKSDIFFSFFMI